MDIFDRIYALLGGGDIMRGARIFDIGLAALFVLIIIMAVVFFVMATRSERRMKSVSLTSRKTRKARERRHRNVFNIEGAAPVAGDDDDGSAPPSDVKSMTTVDGSAALDAVRRAHGDIPEGAAPKVSLKGAADDVPDDDDADGQAQDDPYDARVQSAVPADAGIRQDGWEGTVRRSDGPRHARHAADGNPFGRPIGIDEIRGNGR